MAENKMKVFISYPRAELLAVDEIACGLEYDGGFEVFVDREDLHEGEDWRQGLQSLLLLSDAVVFVLTPDINKHQYVLWELELAQNLKKKLVPVLLKPVNDGDVPQVLALLNYVRFDGQQSFMSALVALRRALRTDVAWVREHTRLLLHAQEWSAANKPEERLLIGDALKNAQSWIEKVPIGDLQATELHREYIFRSETAESVRLSDERKRADALQKAVGRTQIALALALLLASFAIGASALAYIRQNEAKGAKELLAKQVDDLKRSEAEVTDYYNQAAESARNYALLRFQNILVKHSNDPSRSQSMQSAGDKTVDEADADLLKHASRRSIEALINFETGGQERYENLFARPTWPGVQSGVTIGIGFDLGHAVDSPQEFREIWKELPENDIVRLTEAVGLKGEDARLFCEKVSDINIPYNISISVFEKKLLPKYVAMVAKNFPRSTQLPPDAFGALVSIVYNRGASLAGDRRREMLAIRHLIELGELKEVPEQIRAMKWLWRKDIKGLSKRRELEASLFQDSIESSNRGTNDKIP